MKRRNNGSHGIKDALLPDESPHNDLYEKVVPIWSEAPHDDSDWEVVERWSCGFSAGFEDGLIMAMLKPEWAHGFYHKLREHYLTTHTPEDLLDWERCAEDTARAFPIQLELRRERRG